MGNLLREYWMPMLPSKELPEPDCAPKRVRLLGEDLIAWRNTDGSTGVVQNACPHRGASLFFGRNEENGLRCVYHGWKFDVTGACVDMPNEPAESNFKHKIRAAAYPTWEKNGMIWAYMGKLATPPAIPAFEFNTLPQKYCYEPTMMLEQNNWVQGVEGDIDTSHIDFLHARLKLGEGDPQGNGRPGIRGFFSRDKAPRLEIVPTDYGAFYCGRRVWHEGQNNYWYRITQYLLPFWTMIAASDPNRLSARAWVPIDDETTLLYNLPVSLSGPIPPERRAGVQAAEMVGGFVDDKGNPKKRYLFKAHRDNDYLIDYEAQKTKMFSGIPFAGNLQDIAMTESMGVIYQRHREHLGTSDAMVIFVRRALLTAAKTYRDTGQLPPGTSDPKVYRVRSASIVLPEGEDWVAATNPARSADSGSPVSYIIPR
jgi:nitrite reductase/ring-hydroxylating ferredoxin subunit